ncbi:MAG: hypothetical protein A2577_07525 [Bdellovibrionales bacterium RIFOXYD1_FULL_36_51]|nr:MAG: hypothetical protein A2417_06390 [Bdellovibrionales bacterium RIFOXYC1_FULL_37_79]OFZ63778.1 MAG: hypothetical protein A2577_07525 [Bdellovibrionales bacterium RIFOXYD1_FULL_36_51]
MTLNRIFQEAVLNFPGHVAIDVPSLDKNKNRLKFTYNEIDNLSNFLCQKIHSFIKKDSVVAISLPRDSHYIYVAELAVLKCGGAYTVIDASFPKARGEFILNDSKAVLLITNNNLLNFSPAKTININIIDKQNNCAVAYKSPEWLDANCLAYLIYTSGTTGHPKGVMIEHRSVTNLVLSDRDYFKLAPKVRIAQTSSNSYDSSVEEIWLAFGCGGTLVVASDDVVRLGPDLGKWLQDEKINVLCPPPTLLRMGVSGNPQKDFPDLQLLYVGGEALPLEIVEKWAPGRWLENGYGPTECSITITRARVFENYPVTIGSPVVNNLAHVLDSNLCEVAEGSEGELCISGVALARGYLNKPELTSDKFIQHPKLGRIYRTGDLVSRNSDNLLIYHGRIDSQVKLRGYRIELGAIETAIKENSQVQDAACKVQETPRGQILVGYIIPHEEVDFTQIKENLLKKLPSYMIPNYFLLINEMPISLSSGKLNRSALPDYEVKITSANRKMVLPESQLEIVIANEIKKVLHISEDISVHDNFFEIGGDSLSAAMVISGLRCNELTSVLTVRDLYDGQTVFELCKKAIKRQPQQVSEDVLIEGKPITVTIVQLIWILFRVLSAGVCGYFLMYHVMPFFFLSFGIYLSVIIIPMLLLFLTFLYIPFSMLTTAILKQALIGTYKEESYPIWGSMYLKNWIVTQSVRLVPLNLVDGTIFKNFFLKTMGVNIGKNVYFQKGANVIMGGWDLLTIGDNVTIGREASVRTMDFQYGKIVFGKIEIGNNCTIETRASMSIHSKMQDNSKLTGLSMLESFGVIPENEVWEGVPATYKDKNGDPPHDMVKCQKLSSIKHGLILISLRILMYLFTYIHVPLIAGLAIWYWRIDAAKVLSWIFANSFSLESVYAFSVIAVIFCFIRLILQAMFCRILGPIKPGYYCRYGTKYIHMWLKDMMVELAGNTLSGTLFWPYWLRLAGMKIGKNCEISTIMNVVPELVKIDDEVFFADGIYLGGPTVDRQIVYVGEVHLSKNTFIGNHSIIPSESKLPEDILMGICTVADHHKMEKGSSWFGHPSFRLPNREVLELPRELTHNPAWYRYLTRLFWETLRFFTPVVPAIVAIMWVSVTSYYSQNQSNLQFFGLTMHLITISFMLFMVMLIFVMKWCLLGKVKPGIHPLWSCWCSRWDFLYVVWAQYARKVLAYFEGTLMLGWWLRLMGAKVGKRVLLGNGFAQVVDPDMLRFDDYATVLCMFQAHSFEDRILKIAPVHIKKGATVGNAAVLLYGADIGEKTRVYDNSVVMKNERLMPAHQYVGCPTSCI